MYAGRTPRFVKRYAEIAEEIGGALAAYASDVRAGAFPEERHTYAIADEELALFEEGLAARGR
jgi:3-methyl-2-oxobutanoate hydroxymethyltransferase